MKNEERKAFELTVENRERAMARVAELEQQLAALKAQAGGVVLPDADELSNFMRSIDGNHKMGTGLLAEKIVDWLARLNQQPASGGVDERAAFEADELRRHPGAPMFRLPESHRRSGEYQNQYVESAWRAWQARAALAQSERVPEGWQLVPVEPTEAMLSAVTTSKHRELRSEVMRMAATDYGLMLAAAPSPSKQGGV